MTRLILVIAILASTSHAAGPRMSVAEASASNGSCDFPSKTGPVESKFMIAIWQGNLKTVAQGLSEASNLNVKITIPCDDGGGDYTTTPLLNAIQGGHPEMVEFLLQHGASPDFPDASAPLQMAVSKNDLAAVRLLLRFGAHVGGRQISAPPLLDAVQTRNSSAIVQTLIQAGANIEATDDEDNNALALAALGHNDEAVRSFTMLGLDPCARNSHRESALDWAATDRNADPEKEQVTRFLRNACSRANSAEALPLQTSSALPLPLDRNLGVGIFLGDSGVLQKLQAALPNLNTIVTLSPGVNKSSPIGTTPLLLAVMGRHTDLVEMLLHQGADPNLHPLHLDSPLALASRLGDVATVKKLLSFGAKVNAANENGETPLLLAAWNSSDTGLLLDLIAAGADVHAVDTEGNNAVTLAAWNSASSASDNHEVVKLLASSGVDPCAKNKQGKTARDFARSAFDGVIVASFLADRCH